MFARIKHYEILRKIGQGAMGEVFEAVDTRLGRKVAIKLIAEKLMNDRNRVKRFFQEARAAANLSHPNICTVFENGESEDGRSFIAMELIEGESLGQQIGKRPLHPNQIVELSLQIADALHEAHHKGILHRDIKPANIMINTRGHVKVLDFGLAKLLPDLQAVLGAEPDQLPETREGLAVGTLPYMSPEQLSGRPADHRSDLFSFGVMLYEMATGTRPFVGKTEPALAGEILNKDPVPPTSLNPHIPANLDLVIAKALEKQPELRYQSALEIKADLGRLKRDSDARAIHPPSVEPEVKAWWRTGLPRVGLILLCAAALVGLFHLLSGLPGGPSINTPSIAIPEDRHVIILPDADEAISEEDRAISRGMALYLQHRLSVLQRHDDRLTLESVTLLDYFRPKTLSEARAKFGATLGVNIAVRLGQPSDRLGLHLVDLSTQDEIGREVIEDPRANIGSWQDRVPERLAAMLRLHIPEGSIEKAPGSRTPFWRAFVLFLQGSGHLWEPCDERSLEEARILLSQALELDSGYALAHCALGRACWKAYVVSRDASLLEQSLESLSRAARLDEDLSVAHAMLGFVLKETGRLAEAEVALRRALDADPLNLEALHHLAKVLEKRGELQEAQELHQKAVYLRPRYWQPLIRFGLFYDRQNDYQAAVNQLRRAADLVPDSTVPYLNLGAIYMRLERWSDAREMLEKAIAIEPTEEALSNLATLYYHESRFADAAETYERVLTFDDTKYYLWGNLASACVPVPGKEERAAQALERAVALAEEQLAINPNDAEVLADLASYYSMMEESDRALACLTKALEVSGDNADLMALAATVYEQQGDRERALASVEKALDLGYSTKLLERSPAMEGLRGDPRYRLLIKVFADNNP